MGKWDVAKAYQVCSLTLLFLVSRFTFLDISHDANILVNKLTKLRKTENVTVLIGLLSLAESR